MDLVDDPVHGMAHIEGVVENAIILLEQYPEANKEVTILSAYWHDVGRINGKKGHGLKSAEMLKEELEKLNYNHDFINDCYKAIYKHEEKNKLDTIEATIIRDADKLDTIGINRWKNCVEKDVRPPRLIPHTKEKYLTLDYSKELYDIKLKKWLDYIKDLMTK